MHLCPTDKFRPSPVADASAVAAQVCPPAAAAAAATAASNDNSFWLSGKSEANTKVHRQMAT